MALEGNIKDFGVADILQLISQQQKTGILVVERKEEKAEIYFSDGQITETRVSRGTREPLGEMLVKAKLISVDNLKRVLDKQKENFAYLGQILIKDDLISKDLLDKVIQVQVYETFYDILQWCEGSYRFVPEKVIIDHDISAIPSLESILLDVFRMIDEGPDVKKVITSYDTVFDKIEQENPEDLYPDESLVYSLVDGQRPVQAIIDEGLSGRFATCKILAELLQLGCIKQISEKSEKRTTGARFPFQQAVGLLSYAGLIIILSALFYLPTRLPESVLPILNPKDPGKLHLQTYFRGVIIQKLEKALEMFYLQGRGYPESLDELVSAGILHDDDLKVGGGISIAYSKAGRFYTLKIEN